MLSSASYELVARTVQSQQPKEIRLTEPENLSLKWICEEIGLTSPELKK
jgi:hypothetical protein